MRVQDRQRAGSLAGPGGDPAEIRSAATHLRRLAQRAMAISAVRGQAAVELDLVWSGAAAELASAELAVLSERSRAVLPQLPDAAAALSAYALALEDASARSRALRGRAAAALEEHHHMVAAAHAAGADPATLTAALTRADELLAQGLATIHRAHDRAMEEHTAAAARCAQRLSSLTTNGAAGTAGPSGAHEAMLRGLPFVRAEIEIASRPSTGSWSPPEQQDWWEAALETVGDGAAWVYNHGAVPLVNGAANVVEAVAEHPEDLLEMALGAGMIVVGAGGEVAGVALDATGVGAVAGVPLNVAAAAVIAAGAGAATHGASRLANHAAQNDNRLLKEVDGPSVGGRGQPGEPLPDSMRPELAGSNWKGRIADNGRGEVWQDPDMISVPDGSAKNRNAIRFMDPKPGHPYGYVVFYNKEGQPVRLDARTGTRDETHLPVREDGTFDVPLGWNP